MSQLSDPTLSDPKLTRYLGDAVYVTTDPVGLVLRVFDGVHINDEIVLEPEVLKALVTFATEKGVLSRVN